MKNIWKFVTNYQSTLWNPHHLSEASEAAGGNKGYFWHLWLAMAEAGFLFLLLIGSIIHAFIPWALDFKLLEWRINRLKVLKSRLPNDSRLQGIHFDE